MLITESTFFGQRMPQKSVRRTRLAQSKCNLECLRDVVQSLGQSSQCYQLYICGQNLLVSVLSLSCVYTTVGKELPNCTFWLGRIWYKVWTFIGRRFRIEENFLSPFRRFSLEWIVWWHLVWLFKTSFVFIGVHCWRWLSHPTGCSQTWYLSYVVCMCCTLNYVSDKCPNFLTKSFFFLQTDRQFLSYS